MPDYPSSEKTTSLDSVTLEELKEEDIIPIGIIGDTPTGRMKGITKGELFPQRKLYETIFSEVLNMEYFGGTREEAIAPAALNMVSELFDDVSLTRFTQLSESALGTLSIATGQATITHNSGSNKSNFIIEGDSINMPQVMLSVDLISQTGTVGAYCAVLLGIIKDENNYIVANYSLKNVASNLTIQIKIGSSSSFHFAVTKTPELPETLGFSIVGNSLVIWTKTTAGVWTIRTYFDFTGTIDLKAQDLSLWHGMFGLATPGDNTNSVVYDNFKIGRFGGVGIRDITAVTNEKGNPIVVDGKSLCLASLPDPTGQIAGTSLAVVSIDLTVPSVTQVGLIMVNRGGKIQNDQAGHILLKDNGDQIFSVSTWGDAPTATNILIKLELLSTQNLLSGSHIVSSMLACNLTVLPSGGSRWDPFLVKIGTIYYMAYVASDVSAYSFYPVLDSSTDLSTWENIGSAPTDTRHEGTKIVIVDGEYFVVAGTQFTMKSYELLTMKPRGLLHITSPGTGVTQPHPMIVPYKKLLYILTFDDTKYPPGGSNFSWGNLRIFVSPRY